VKERRWKCSSLKKKKFYTKLYLVKKAHKEGMEVEGERVKKTRKQYKPKAVKTGTGWYKTYVKKEMMALENIKHTKADNKSYRNEENLL